MRVRGVSMKRRAFFALVAGSAAAYVAAGAGANERAQKRIGVLMGGTEHDLDWQRLEAAFEQELKNLGWLRGRELRIDYRWPGDDLDRINASAIELVELGPDLIITAATYGVQAIRRRTDSIPIVFINAAD